MRFILLNLVTKETDPESSGLTKATRQRALLAISGGPEVTWLCVTSEICCEALVVP